MKRWNTYIRECQPGMDNCRAALEQADEDGLMVFQVEHCGSWTYIYCRREIEDEAEEEEAAKRRAFDLAVQMTFGARRARSVLLANLGITEEDIAAARENQPKPHEER